MMKLLQEFKNEILKSLYRGFGYLWALYLVDRVFNGGGFFYLLEILGDMSARS